MPFDPLTWSIGYIAKRGIDKLVDTFTGKELTQNLKREANAWVKSLPEAYRIEPEVFFLLPSKGNNIDAEKFPNRSRLHDKLVSNQVPSSDDWFNAFIEHRDERRNTLNDQAHIFIRSDNVLIDPYLKELANRFNNACLQTTSFFQQTVINTLHYQSKSLENLSDINLLCGIDERELASYLEKLTSTTKEERKKEVQQWYKEKTISANLKEALNTVIVRIDEELKASRETIERLRAKNESGLAELLERLNEAFEKGISNLGKEEADILKELEKKVVQNTIEVYLSTAEKYETALQFHKALDRYTHAYKLQKDFLGSDSEKLPFILNQLGRLHQIIASHRQSIDYFEQALIINLKQHGPDHQEVARGLNQLGFVWNSLGQPVKAIDYFEKSLAINVKTYGLNHPKVATGWTNIGTAWDSLGQYDKAAKYFVKALTSDMKAFGPNHPNVAIGWNNLGAVFSSMEIEDEAIECYEKALAINVKNYGQDHPNVATTLNNIGLAWCNLGKYDKSLKCLRKAEALYLKIYGPDHPDVTLCWNGLGLLWNSLGQPVKAIGYYEKSLAINVKNYGQNHPKVATTLNNIGSAWCSLGEYNKSLEYLVKALNSNLKIYGYDHPGVARNLNNIGYAWYSLGRDDKAIEHFEKALSIFEKVLGKDHPETEKAIHNLNSVRTGINEIDFSMKYPDDYEKHSKDN